MMNKGCLLKCYINIQVLVEMYYMNGSHCRHFWDKASPKENSLTFLLIRFF